jgi:DNA-binding IclR family transcriptional regulator
MQLDRLIMILETVAMAGRPVSAVEVRKATGLPKPTCYRYIEAVLYYQLITSPAVDGRFVIGERLVRISLLGTSDIDVQRTAEPLLKSAAAKFNESVFLARLRHQKVEIIHIDTPNDPRRAFIYPGLGERPLHACSCSKAIAAFADPKLQDKIVHGALQRFTTYTKTTEAELRAEFAWIRERGFAECNEEIDLGVASVAAPISVGHEGAMFSVGAVGPIRRFCETYRHHVGMALTELAGRLGRTLKLGHFAKV